MGKKLEEIFWNEVEANGVQAEGVLKQFYPGGTLEKVIPLSSNIAVSNLFRRAEELTKTQNMSQGDFERQCLQIHENVKVGKEGNVEIRLDKAEQLFERKKYPLGSTIFKIRFFDDEGPSVLFIKGGYTMDSRIFIGESNATAVMATRKEDGTVNYTALAEFHLLSIQENPDPQKEVGLMTSYVWLTARVYSSVIFAFNLCVIKNLLLSEWLLSEWQRAKETNDRLSEETRGDDVNG